MTRMPICPKERVLFHAMRIGRQAASLPISGKPTPEDARDVTGAVRRVMQ
jgi:hypothetical protein